MSCYFWVDLRWCNNCFWCVWLQNKNYHIFNKEFSKEDYFEQLKKYNIWSYEWLLIIKQGFEEFYYNFIKCYSFQINCIESSWNWLNNCKNVLESFDIFNWENCKYYWGWSDWPISSYDILIWGKHELCYESLVPDLAYKACFTDYCFNSSNICYSEHCYSCQNCFWCVGLKNKKYCILNKQYRKEEYEELVPKIIEHMMNFPSPYGRGVRGEGWEWW